jgi:hypothetical protein
MHKLMRSSFQKLILLLLASSILAQLAFCEFIEDSDSLSHIVIHPPSRLENMQLKADVIFKGQALNSTFITNKSFQIPCKIAATQFKLISVLQGNPHTHIITLQHFASVAECGFLGPAPPAYYQFKAGQSYLIFAANLGKPDDFYSPISGMTNTLDVFRQIADSQKARDDGAMHTLDSRPLPNVSVKDAHWLELNLLLNDSNPSNKLYAINRLDYMSPPGRGVYDSFRSGDFKRHDVLAALLPLTTNDNQEVAICAINCFQTESNSPALSEPFAGTLIQVANEGQSPDRRLAAIAALSGTHFEDISNSLSQLLQNPDENIRASAIGLLVRYPNDFSNQALLKHSEDSSAKVRATVAKVIGDGKIESQLPLLVKLFSDPIGLKESPPPPVLENNGNVKISGDIHASAGHALLKFDVNLTKNILESHLSDPAFRLPFLCKLAECDPRPWVDDMIKVMEEWRIQKIKEADNNREPQNMFINLAGEYYKSWNIIYDYLYSLPASYFTGGQLDHNLEVLENTACNDSEDEIKLYKFYRLKGLNKHASNLRNNYSKINSFDITGYLNSADSEITNSPATLD